MSVTYRGRLVLCIVAAFAMTGLSACDSGSGGSSASPQPSASTTALGLMPCPGKAGVYYKEGLYNMMCRG
jgi:hypothetical protein